MTPPEPIAFSAPLIGEDEIAEVVDTLRSGWITTGPRSIAFAEQFAARVGAPAALAVSSCTAALHLGLLAVGVGPGDAVFTTTMTFCSTVHVIEHTGATPVLCDIEEDTLNLDPIALERAVAAARKAGLRPRAVIPVHYAGHPCDMGAILDLAEANGLAVIEDAAHALPAAWKDEPVGSVGGPVPRAVAFSFYATKNLTTGEGGMLTGNPELIDEARVWSLHGMSRDAWRRYDGGGSWFYDVTRAGFKYNLPDVLAAIGTGQLAKLDQFDATRKRLVDRYHTGLSGVSAVDLPVERPEVDHAWHLYVLRLRLDQLDTGRGEIIDELSARGIGTSVHFIPVHLHPYYARRYGLAPGDFPVAAREWERLVSLPLHLRMSEHDVDRVVAAVDDVIGRHRR